jgi:hypothetical protein
VLQHVNVFREGDIDAAAEALDDVKLSPHYLPYSANFKYQFLQLF